MFYFFFSSIYIYIFFFIVILPVVAKFATLAVGLHLFSKVGAPVWPSGVL